VHVRISPSENYDRDDVRTLLDELSGEGVEVTQASFYGRRSMDALPPALIMRNCLKKGGARVVRSPSRRIARCLPASVLA